jgi:SPP1 gp7 family putative phage head morphogenesis protein
VNPHDQAKIDAIERDRKRREDEILLALLLLWDDAEDDIIVPMRHGFDAKQVLYNVQPRATKALTDTMALAHRDGVRRVTVLTGGNPPRGPGASTWLDQQAGTTTELATIYRPAAQQSTDAMVKSIGDALDKYVPGQGRGLSNVELKTAVREAFDAAGYTANHPMALDLGAERAVVGAHNNGMIAGGKSIGKVTGLRHVSIIDESTTNICRSRDGITLPIGDPFWTNGIPPLHWNCRSALLPVTGEFESYMPDYVVPPAPGFGAMSAVFIQRLRAA